jgi:hypothetical protein
MEGETSRLKVGQFAGSSAAALADGIPPTIFVNVPLQRVG